MSRHRRGETHATMVLSLPPKETLPQLIRRSLEEPRAEVLLERVNGAFAPTSSETLLRRVEAIACAIRDAGLQAGDRVGLIAHDCVDWIVCDFATFFAGCVVVPVFPTQALDNTQYILEHSGAKLLFVDTAETLERLSGAMTLPRTIAFESAGDDGLAAFERCGDAIRVAHPELPTAYQTAQPDDLAVLIYTSGTTGNPKGVMLSHDNLGFDAAAAERCSGSLTVGSDVLSVLPFSHIYEHTMIYIYLQSKYRYSISHDPNALLEDLQTIRPEALTCVPRIFDKVLAGIVTKSMHVGGLQAKLVPWALEVGRKYMDAKEFGGGPGAGLAMQYALAKALVFKKLRAVLGLDRLKYFSSGSAALHVDVAMTYLGMGLPIVQGYGLTETSPIMTVNRPEANKYGTVGQALDGVEVRIAEDGEVLTRGRLVMLGYYHDPEATAETIQDGWLHTGDIGELDADGFLRITDRKKEVFKTDTGKFVAPARVEAAIKRSVYVGQAMVVGDGRPHPAALVAPNWDPVKMELHIEGGSPEEWIARDDVRAFMTAQIVKETADLGSYEQIRRVLLIPHEFSVESGELSPSFKIKRRVVEERYRSQIAAAYAVDLHARKYV
jgi:long-chain acyl-CoA synthetase